MTFENAINWIVDEDSFLVSSMKTMQNNIVGRPLPESQGEVLLGGRKSTSSMGWSLGIIHALLRPARFGNVHGDNFNVSFARLGWCAGWFLKEPTEMEWYNYQWSQIIGMLFARLPTVQDYKWLPERHMGGALRTNVMNSQAIGADCNLPGQTERSQW